MSFYSLLGFNPKKQSRRTEMMAGVTTFLTMSYILAVNPDILSAAGMDKGAVFTATALASALGTLFIAFLAKLPFAQAPGMGINAFFAFTLVRGMGYSWEAALAAVFVEGLIFILLTALNIREQIVIAFIGLKNAGLVVANDATFVSLGAFTPTAALASLGIILSGALLVLKVRGALFYSILICTVVGIPMGITQIPDAFVPVSLPHSIAPTFLKLDFAALLNVDMILTVFVLVFIDIFNTLGTLIGTAAKTDMMDENGNVKNIQKAMMADAIATSTGALLGTSTVTTFVESAAGVAEGGRTGLTAFTTAMFFLVALFMAPLFLIIPSAATTGALVLVGVFMLESIKKIDLQDISEALPCFITVLMMVLTYSIAEGMALGLISYTLVKLLSGNYKDVNITLFIVSTLLVLRYVFQ